MPKKILLADDSITIQKVVELTFSDGDYEVVAVGNGQRAIEKMNEWLPDIVLADVIMPEKNGYDLCEAIKGTPATASIPVILLTGTFEPFDPDRAEQVRSDAVITKPFESQNLIGKVEQLLSAETGPAPTTAPSPPPAEAPAAGDDIFASSDIESDIAAFQRDTPEPPAPVEPPQAAAFSEPAADDSVFAAADAAATPPADAGDSFGTMFIPSASLADEEPSEPEPPADEPPAAMDDEPPMEAFPADPGPAVEEAAGAMIDETPEDAFPSEPAPELASEEFPPASSPESGEDFTTAEPMGDQAPPEPEAAAVDPFAAFAAPPEAPGEARTEEVASSDVFSQADAAATDAGDGAGTMFIPPGGAEIPQEPPVSEVEETRPLVVDAGAFAPPPDEDVFAGVPEESSSDSPAESPFGESASEDPFAASEAPAEPETPMEGAAEVEAESVEPAPFGAPLGGDEAVTDAAVTETIPFEAALEPPVAEETPAESMDTDAGIEASPVMEMAPPAAEIVAVEPEVSEPVEAQDEPGDEPAAPVGSVAVDSAPAEGRSMDAGALSDDDVERIARRVVELLGTDVVREIAWEVIPELAEILVKKRIAELESEVG